MLDWEGFAVCGWRSRRKEGTEGRKVDVQRYLSIVLLGSVLHSLFPAWSCVCTHLCSFPHTNARMISWSQRTITGTRPLHQSFCGYEYCEVFVHIDIAAVIVRGRPPHRDGRQCAGCDELWRILAFKKHHTQKPRTAEGNRLTQWTTDHTGYEIVRKTQEDGKWAVDEE